MTPPVTMAAARAAVERGRGLWNVFAGMGSPGGLVSDTQAASGPRPRPSGQQASGRVLAAWSGAAVRTASRRIARRAV